MSSDEPSLQRDEEEAFESLNTTLSIRFTLSSLLTLLPPFLFDPSSISNPLIDHKITSQHRLLVRTENEFKSKIRWKSKSHWGARGRCGSGAGGGGRQEEKRWSSCAFKRTWELFHWFLLSEKAGWFKTFENFCFHVFCFLSLSLSVTVLLLPETWHSPPYEPSVRHIHPYWKVFEFPNLPVF